MLSSPDPESRSLVTRDDVICPDRAPTDEGLCHKYGINGYLKQAADGLRPALWISEVGQRGVGCDEVVSGQC